jgi:hypothetical protein
VEWSSALAWNHYPLSYGIVNRIAVEYTDDLPNAVQRKIVFGQEGYWICTIQYVSSRNSIGASRGRFGDL